MHEMEKFIIERMEDKPTLSELYGGEVTFGFSFVMELMEEWSKLHQPTVISCVKCELPLVNPYKLTEHEHGDYACRNCDARYIKNESGLLHYYPIT